MNKPLKMMRVLLFTLISVLFSNLLTAQFPATEMYLFDIKKEEGSFQFTNPKLISHFNPGRYNNQPQFFNANTIYFSSNTRGKKQTDIFALDLFRKKYWQVTDTENGEYSPTLMPDRNHFSCIVQEAVDNTQRLWSFPIDQSNAGKDLFPGITGVGYHSWIDEENVAMFIVGDPIKLIVANSTTQEKRTVIENIGRALKTNKVGRLYFIHKINDENWVIKRYDHARQNIESIISTPGKSEDFTLLSDETIIMGSGSKLYSFNPDRDNDWNEVQDLADWGIKNITRLDIQGSKLVLVSNQ